ncbi:MAG TPA: hypothetical protein VK213_08095 [Bacteroidales bacterium]|nr:hypothetical protein [Bacteroidales bacterium]
MKKLFLLIAILAVVSTFCNSSFSQDSTTLRSQMLDVKLQLLDSKLDLLDTKIKLWESKPKELDIKLSELDSRIKQMDFEPATVNKRLGELDSMIRLSLERPVMESHVQEPERRVEPGEPIFNPSYKSAIMLDPVRLLEGTFSMAYERVINQRFTGNATLMMTYSTKQGISNMYFSNQKFALFDAVTNSYENYTGEVMAGAGFQLQFRNYLLAGRPGRMNSPAGLYAAPEVMYRHYRITGYSKKWGTNPEGLPEWIDQQVVQNLDVVAAGAVLGYKIPVFKVLAVDIFVGGNIRLSKYFREHGFTKYKDIYNFDFSGVSPVAGIMIGILK